MFFSYRIRNGLFDSKGTLILNTTIEPILSRQSGAFDFFKRVQKIFGKNELMVIALEKVDRSRPGIVFLERYRELSQFFSKKLKGVEKSISLLDIPVIFGECPGMSQFHVKNFKGCSPSCITLDEKFRLELSLIAGSKICAKIPRRSMDEVQREYDARTFEILSQLAKEPVIQKDLLGKDSRTAAFMIFFDDSVRPSDSAIQSQIQKLADSAALQNLRFAYAGRSRLEYEASRIIQNDVKHILPLGLLLMIVVLALSFRRITGVLIPLVIVSTGLLWTAGIFSLTSWRLNLMTIVLPPLLISIGSAYVIHIIHQYYHEAALKGDYIDNVLKKMTTPLIVTALTTIAGFAALTISPIPAIRELGIFACIGIAVIIFLSLTLAVAVLKLLPAPKNLKTSEEKRRSGIIDKFLLGMGNLIIKHSKGFIIAWMILGAVAIAGIFRVSVDSDPKNFPDDSPIMLDLKLIQDNLAGTNTFQMIIQDKSGEKVFSLDTAKKIHKFIKWIHSEPEIEKIKGVHLDKIYSPVQYLDLFVRYFNSDISTLTENQFTFIMQKLEEFKAPTFISPDGKYMQMMVRMRISSSTGLIKLKEMISEKFAVIFPDFTLRFTGTGILASESADSISKGQIQSVALALGVIFIILSILFFSFKMGGLALYPNLVAIAVFFGFLGWFSIPVGVTISVIASIALGIGVDNTIHFLSDFNEKVKVIRDEKLASVETLRHVGQPMIFTTLSLGLGFGIFAVSDMSAQVLFGALMAFTLFVCLIAGLNFLPSIVVQSRLITAWDYLSLHYDTDFIQEITLFKGMTIPETKISMLMAYTVEMNDGDILFRKNDRGNELYAVIEGTVVVYNVSDTTGKEQPLSYFQVGSTFGEIALFRKTFRTTYARAIGNVKLLVLNEKTLQRLKRRYPKIAAKLFINLSKNLWNAITDTNHILVDSFVSQNGSNNSEQQINRILDNVEKQGYISYTGKANLEEVARRVSLEKERISNLMRRTDIGEIELRPHSDNFMFQGLRKKEIDWLKEKFSTRSFKTGDIVCNQGAEGNAFGVVLSGILRLSIKRAQGEVTVATAHYGYLVGQGSILAPDSKHHETVAAMENCEVLMMDKFMAMDVLGKNAHIASQFTYNMVCLLADRLEHLTVKISIP
ncbi:MAG: MMPL family transporter [Deltaproteobacteria bacterium]|nr:MMPL family transporter [Deltaproteobacteria bacterium]